MVGVDIAASMLGVARKANRHGPRVDYVLNERPDLAVFPNASFDFVLTVLVLQHMRPDYAAGYLREFLRVLRPGGSRFFQIPIEPIAPQPILVRSSAQSPLRCRPWASELGAVSAVPFHGVGKHRTTAWVCPSLPLRMHGCMVLLACHTTRRSSPHLAQRGAYMIIVRSSTWFSKGNA